MARTRAPGSSRNSERFSSVPPTRVPRSVFDMSHDHKTTISSGLLIPVWFEELLPGDTVVVKPSFFARMATPLRPYMDGLHLDWQLFACNNTLLWDNWVKLMGERENPDDHNDYLVPIINAPGPDGYAEGTIHDYLGLPTGVGPYEHIALFHRAYNLIYNEWFRDENLQDQVVVNRGDGPDDPADYTLLRRGKRKDYFSGALPFQQKGDPVDITPDARVPLGGIARPVGSPTTAPLFDPAPGGSPNNESALQIENGVTQTLGINSSGTITSGQAVLWGSNTALSVDLSTGPVPGFEPYADIAGALTVQALRTSIALQRVLELDARGGTRYREHVLATFGVQTDDQRLFRPQLVATGSMPITPTPVANTAGDNEVQGDLAAFATGGGVGRSGSFSATQHAVMMLLVSVRADLTYQQGLDARWSRRSRFDFFHPELAHIGEEAVLSREIYLDATGDEASGTGDYSVWGYQPRWESMRHRRSYVTGQMRSSFAQSLDSWHLALDFASRPALNAAFIEENPPVSRVIAVPSEPEFILDCHFDVRHARPMPKFGTPGMTRF
jgi:hypothetical protein